MDTIVGDYRIRKVQGFFSVPSYELWPVESRPINAPVAVIDSQLGAVSFALGAMYVDGFVMGNRAGNDKMVLALKLMSDLKDSLR